MERPDARLRGSEGGDELRCDGDGTGPLVFKSNIGLVLIAVVLKSNRASE